MTVKAAGVAPLLACLVLSGAPSHVQAAPPTSKVVVDNDSANPVPVKAIVEEPVQATGGGSFTGPAVGFNFLIYTVPAGKRLVVEHFSSELGVPTGTSVNRYSLGIAPNPSTPGGVRFSHFLPPSYSSPCGACVAGQTEVIASQAVRMYVEAGEGLVVNVTFSTAVADPNTFSFFAVTGHLIDVP
jgi:hypothetical protein